MGNKKKGLIQYYNYISLYMLQLGEAQTQTKKNIVDVKQNNGSNKATIKKKKILPSM